MYKVDPTHYYSYQLLPDCSTQTPGENFTGEVTVKWKIWMALDNSSPATTVFSYTDGVPDDVDWGQPIYIHEILKSLTLGSASAIQFPLDLAFPRISSDEKGLLIFTIKSFRPRLQPERLMLLDDAPRGIGRLFFEVMSRLDWKIVPEDIPWASSKWGGELLKDSRPYWYRFSLEYCEGVKEKEDICAIPLRNSTKASPFCPPSS